MCYELHDHATPRAYFMVDFFPHPLSFVNLTLKENSGVNQLLSLLFEVSAVLEKKTLKPHTT